MRNINLHAGHAKPVLRLIQVLPAIWSRCNADHSPWLFTDASRDKLKRQRCQPFDFRGELRR
jgi:hypothetical protein